MFESQRSTLPVKALNHISRVCKSVTTSAAFYRDVLGFTEVKRPSSFEFEGAWLFNYGVGIHLIAGVPPVRDSKINPKSDHMSFQADCLEDVERCLDMMQVEYVKQTIVEGSVRITQLFFHDPDNNMIEICNCDLLPVEPLERPTVCPTCVMSAPSENCDVMDDCSGRRSSSEASSDDGFSDPAMVAWALAPVLSEKYISPVYDPPASNTLRRSCSMSLLLAHSHSSPGTGLASMAL